MAWFEILGHVYLISTEAFKNTTVYGEHSRYELDAIMSPNDQQEAPGLIAAHAQYVKGAAVVRFRPSDRVLEDHAFRRTGVSGCSQQPRRLCFVDRKLSRLGNREQLLYRRSIVPQYR